MVRMWLPGAGRPPQEWRGSVRDIAADQTYYVVGTREIADYIAGALATPERRGEGGLTSARDGE